MTEIVYLPVTIIHDPNAQIRVLRINGKRVSFAQFRQFPNKSIIDIEVPKLIETPLGWVNYTWGSQDVGFRNFIATAGSTLYVSPVLMRWSDQSAPTRRGRILPYCENHDAAWCRRWDELVDSLWEVEQVFIAT